MKESPMHFYEWRQYRKAFVAWLVPVLLVIQMVITGGITSAEWISIILATVGASAVQQVPNDPTKQQIEVIRDAMG